MNEYLAKIRFIKMYCWEKALSKLVASKYTCLYLRINVDLMKRRISRGHKHGTTIGVQFDYKEARTVIRAPIVLMIRALEKKKIPHRQQGVLRRSSSPLFAL